MSKPLVDNMSRLTKAFHGSPDDVIIIGLDTEHKSVLEHPLYDGDRNAMPLKAETIQNFVMLGCVEPAIVQREDIGLVVVDGRQRVKYLRAANEQRKELGLSPYTLPVVLNTDADRGLLLAESLNTHRWGDEILTKAHRALGMETKGIKMEDMRNAFGGISESTVKNFVRLAQSDKKVQEALRDGLISPAAAYTLARIKTKTEQKEALERLLSEPEDDPKVKASDSLYKALVRAVKLGVSENRINEAWEMGLAEGQKLRKRKDKKAKSSEKASEKKKTEDGEPAA